MSKCPVCDYEIENPVSVKSGDGEVVVCCDECAEKVKENPKEYATGKSAHH